MSNQYDRKRATHYQRLYTYTYIRRRSWTRPTYRDNVRCTQVDRAAAISRALIYHYLFIWILVERKAVLSSVQRCLSSRGIFEVRA
ncbi:hypothetical protein ANTPLA_LOCUS10142 [Anthophora plagiata]